MNLIKNVMMVAVFALGGFVSSAALAQVDLDNVKKTINENWSKAALSFPEVKEVRTTPINGLYEVVVGGDVIYTDISGNYVLIGELMDVKGQRNLTQERQTSLIQPIEFDQLPFENAIVIKRGNGERKLVIFEDPNCGFCHKIERDLLKVDNVTVYMFLLPILSEDSRTVATSIWCAQDPHKTWMDWMVNSQKPPVMKCDWAKAVLDGNVKIAQNYAINGTPTLVFSDGSRFPGAVGADAVEAKFKEIYGQ